MILLPQQTYNKQVEKIKQHIILHYTTLTKIYNKLVSLVLSFKDFWWTFTFQNTKKQNNKLDAYYIILYCIKINDLD